MKKTEQRWKHPDPDQPIIPPPSEDVSTENTATSPITITHKPNAS